MWCLVHVCMCEHFVLEKLRLQPWGAEPQVQSAICTPHSAPWLITCFTAWVTEDVTCYSPLWPCSEDGNPGNILWTKCVNEHIWGVVFHVLSDGLTVLVKENLKSCSNFQGWDYFKDVIVYGDFPSNWVDNDTKDQEITIFTGGRGYIFLRISIQHGTTCLCNVVHVWAGSSTEGTKNHRWLGHLFL